MSSSRNRAIQRAAKTRRVVDHAREIADIGDHWFLSMAAGLGRAGIWARKEADIAADSAVAAFATTMMVAKKLMALSVVGLESGAPRRRDRGEPRPSEGTGSFRPEVTLDLVPANRADDGRRVGASASERLGVKQDSLAVPGPAGVVPLLQALGRTVATHAQAGYASLQEDPRFWTLVHLVQTLGRPTIAPVRSESLLERNVEAPAIATFDGAGSDSSPDVLHHDSDTRRDL
jgi:hypothetical protein